MDNIFIWKNCDQMKYYEIYCNDYLRGIFKEIKLKPYVFYYDYTSEREIHDTAVKYYTSKNKINIKDFKQTKIMKKYKLYPEFTYKPEVFEQYTRDNDINTYDKSLYDNEEQAYFSIDDYEEINEIDSGCYQCKKRYECGINFSGLAYNTGFYDDDPIEYSGYIKNYGFFRCDCDKTDEIICKQPNEDEQCELPRVEIRISLPNNEYYLLNRCMLFNIKYMKKPTE